MSTIKCESLAHLAQVCSELVREGVIFNACTATLVVTLTGGY